MRKAALAWVAAVMVNSPSAPEPSGDVARQEQARADVNRCRRAATPRSTQGRGRRAPGSRSGSAPSRLAYRPTIAS